MPDSFNDHNLGRTLTAVLSVYAMSFNELTYGDRWRKRDGEFLSLWCNWLLSDKDYSPL